MHEERRDYLSCNRHHQFQAHLQRRNPSCHSEPPLDLLPCYQKRPLLLLHELLLISAIVSLTALACQLHLVQAITPPALQQAHSNLECHNYTKHKIPRDSQLRNPVYIVQQGTRTSWRYHLCQRYPRPTSRRKTHLQSHPSSFSERPAVRSTRSVSIASPPIVFLVEFQCVILWERIPMFR